MYPNPIIWIDSNQITGEEIVFKTFKGVVFSMDIENNGMIITKKDEQSLRSDKRTRAQWIF